MRALVVVLPGVAAVHSAKENPIVATITVGPLPTGVAVDPQTRRAFVVDNGNGTIAVLDTASGTPAGTVTVGSGPTDLQCPRPLGR
jgi:YVTN family beta-propeller protein